jgi:hypothetical protein
MTNVHSCFRHYHTRPTCSQWRKMRVAFLIIETLGEKRDSHYMRHANAFHISESVFNDRKIADNRSIVAATSLLPGTSHI